MIYRETSKSFAKLFRRKTRSAMSGTSSINKRKTFSSTVDQISSSVYEAILLIDPTNITSNKISLHILGMFLVKPAITFIET